MNQISSFSSDYAEQQKKEQDKLVQQENEYQKSLPIEDQRI